VYRSLFKTHRKATKHHLPYKITQCYLPQYHPIHMYTPQVNRSVIDSPTPKGWKAELILVLVIYLDGLPFRRRSPIQVVTAC